MNFARFSLNNSILAKMLVFFFLVYGLFTLTGIRKEVFPATEFNIITIQTFYPGASPLDIEKIITNPVEEAIFSVKGIDQISSSSFESLSSVVVRLKPEVTDLDKVFDDIKSRIDKIRDFPEEVEKPEVQKVELDIPVIQVSLSGLSDELSLRREARKLEEILKNVPGVSAIVKLGYKGREIWVEVDPDKLTRYNIALSQVINTIRFKNASIPGGTARNNGKEFIVKTTGEIQDAGEVSRLILRANDAGNLVTVADVAAVKDTFTEQKVLARTFGKEDISLVVQKKSTDDTITVVKRVRAAVESYRKGAPQGMEISLLNDATSSIKIRLDTLTSNGLTGFLLVLITLFLFMNPPAALQTSLNIPFSILGSFIIFSYMGVSLNLISLFGLILVLGMIVDQSIVVAENAYRYLEAGDPPDLAVEKGTNEVILPVIASVLTTIAAFYPLLLIKGITGKFVRDIPIAVIIALIISLVQAFFVLPSLLAQSLKDAAKMGEKLKQMNPVTMWDKLKYRYYRFVKGRDSAHPPKWFVKLKDFYGKLLHKALDRRYLFVLITFLLFVGSIFFAAKVMRFELFSTKGVVAFNIFVKTKDNSSLAVTDKAVSEIERIISQLPADELFSFTSRIGTDQNNNSFFFDQDSDLAIISVRLTEESTRNRTADQIIAALKEATKDIPEIEKLQFRKEQNGPPAGRALNIEVRGEDFSKILPAAESIRKFIAGIDGVYDADLDYREGKQEIRIVLDDKKAAMTGVNVLQAGQIIRTAYEGQKASTVRLEGEAITILVKFDELHGKSAENIRKILIPNQMGQLIPLERIADFRIERSVKRVNHVGLKRTVIVSSEIDPKKTTSRAVNALAKKELKGKFEGVNLVFSGEEQEANRSFGDLGKAFLVALFLIYLILAISFKSFIQPVIIMITIPLGIVGIIFALFFHGLPLGFFSLMGIVALAGVVVNNAILLLDFINQDRKLKDDCSIQDVIVDAGQKRLRPILLTSITTAAGLFTLAYGIGGGDVVLQPLAIGFMWGLLFATLLTLFVVPVIYLVFDEIGRYFDGRKKLKECAKLPE